MVWLSRMQYGGAIQLQQGASVCVQGRRRLLQGGPANNVGIAEWAVSDGEAAGLQYDPYAPVGSLYAQPPLSALQGATGIHLQPRFVAFTPGGEWPL